MFKKIASRLMLVLMFVTLTACAGRNEDYKSIDTGKDSKNSESSKSNSSNDATSSDGKTTIVFWHSMGGNLNDAKLV